MTTGRFDTIGACPMCRTLQPIHNESGLCGRCLAACRSAEPDVRNLQPVTLVTVDLQPKVIPGVWKSTGIRSNGLETFVRIR